MAQADVACTHAIGMADCNESRSDEGREHNTTEAVTVRVSGRRCAEIAVARFVDRTRWVDALSSSGGPQAQYRSVD